MKRFAKLMHGVTLLEVMLVLAIAAMIIVMSIRYYQSANTSQQANNILSQIQSIAAAADTLAQATGTYANVTTSTVAPLLPINGLVTPWGDSITVEAGTSSYSVTINAVPPGVCNIVKAQLQANTHFTGIGDNNCDGVGPFTYTYVSNI